MEGRGHIHRRPDLSEMLHDAATSPQLRKDYPAAAPTDARRRPQAGVGELYGTAEKRELCIFNRNTFENAKFAEFLK